MKQVELAVLDIVEDKLSQTQKSIAFVTVFNQVLFRYISIY